jgi:hypothetical protein
MREPRESTHRVKSSAHRPVAELESVVSSRGGPEGFHPRPEASPLKGDNGSSLKAESLAVSSFRVPCDHTDDAWCCKIGVAWGSGGYFIEQPGNPPPHLAQGEQRPGRVTVAIANPPRPELFSTPDEAQSLLCAATEARWPGVSQDLPMSLDRLLVADDCNQPSGMRMAEESLRSLSSQA